MPSQPLRHAGVGGSGRLIVGTECGTNRPFMTIISLPLTSSPSEKRVPLPAEAKCAAAFAVGSATIFAATIHSGVLAYKLPVDHHSAPAFELGQIVSAEGIAFGPSGRLFVANDDRPRIDVFKAPFSATSKRAFAFAQGASMKQPTTLQFDFQFSLYVADCAAGDILIFNQPYDQQSPPVATLAPEGAGCTAAAAIDSGDVLYVTDSTKNSIYIYNPPFVDASQPSVTITGSASQLDAPGGIAIDDQGDLYVANETGGSLLEFAPPFAPGSAPSLVVKGFGPMLGLDFESSGF